MVQPDLELRMLGGLDVRRGGKPLPLPPSKKTRALLGYLALTGRAHRRDALCSLLWDVTDDPRGALRWSLSKLRKQVDDDGVTRLQTEGERVGLELRGAHVDVLEMRDLLADGKLANAPTELLEAWSGRCTGEVLEGLDLPDFDGYQAWLVAEREQNRRLRASVLQELVSRLEGAPERALPHARAWIAVDPMSTAARLSAMRLSLSIGRVDEAKRQFQAARRVFGELDPSKEAQLVAGWHGLRASPHGTGASPIESEPAPPAPQRPSGEALATRESTTHRKALPLIGREREKAELIDLLAKVTRKRRAQLALITGEPGIGKSRLLDELLAHGRAGGSAVLDGAAFEGETGRPYGPWIDALRKLSGAQLAAVEQDKLAPLLDGSDSQVTSREALFSGVVHVLTGLCAAHAPVLVVLDDVHWLDEGSAELLHYTARMQREQPVLFVLAAREAELHDQQSVLRVLRSLRRDLEVRELALSHLPEAATRELVEHVDPELDAGALFASSGGNPLFALELARAGGRTERARTVADAVRDRVARLPAEAGEVLRWSAVLGTSVDTRLLAALSSLSTEQQLDGLEELERHALLRLDPAQGYVFSHEVVRGVVYSDLSQPRRTLMHHRVAEALCKLKVTALDGLDEAVVALIARHADLGEGHSLAARAHVEAGKRCLKLFAGESAAALARRGLRHARELAEPERCRTMLELFDIQLWAKRPEAPEDFCRTVNELAETALEHGCVEHARLGFNMISYVRWEGGQWDDARKHMLKAEQVVRTGEGVDHVEALAEAACCLGLLERDLGHAEAMVREATARAKQLGHESGTLKNADGLLKLHWGELDAADALFEEGRTMSRAQSQRYAEIRTLLNRVELNLDAGRNGLALELAEEAQKLAEKIRDGSEGPYARVLVALARLALGQERGKTDADADLEGAIEALRVADAKHRLTFGLTRGARLENHRGRHQVARAMAEEALEIAQFLERHSDRILALVELARAQRALNDGAGLEHSRRALAIEPASKISAHARSARDALNQE